MWDTPHGDRNLTGWERRLFIEGVCSLFENLRDCDFPFESGLPAFDQIPIADRRFVLLLVARDVLGRGEAPCRWQWNEAALLAVYRCTYFLMEFDIEYEINFSLREHVYKAWIESVMCDQPASEWATGCGPHQTISSDDADEWKSKMRDLEELMIHDLDAEGAPFLDLHPDIASMIKLQMGIADDYYTEVPPLILERERAQLLLELEGWTKELQADVQSPA